MLNISRQVWGVRQLKNLSVALDRVPPNCTKQQVQQHTMAGLRLDEVVTILEDFAPLSLGEKWDNVGLLIEPYTAKRIHSIFLTNDLTEHVLAEAISVNTDLIIAYHPPIFQGLKRITMRQWKQRLVAACLEHRIALYSPHTTWDSCVGGVNDWLAKSLPLSKSVPIIANADQVTGAGRLVQLARTISLEEAISMIKLHTKLVDVRVAVAVNGSLTSPLQTAAVCAGSGGSVFAGTKADLYLTGEMSHHELLEATQNGTSVVLCNHSNSERGFLHDFKNILHDKLPDTAEIKINVTWTDRDPLQTC